MNYYAIQVRAGTETVFKQDILEQDFTAKYAYSVILPQRMLKIRKKGRISNRQLPVFPGYVFLETEKADIPLFSDIRGVKGFYRFLPNNREPKPLFGRDLDILNHFMSFGSAAKLSKVAFDENDRIKVIDGPMQGLEGQIVQVDKRKGRAKIKLDMFSDSFLIDLGFEVINPAVKKEESK